MDYQYWIIRYVPNLAREEFVNVGIVCGNDNADWCVRFDLHDGDRRVKHGLAGLQSWSRWFERRLAGLRPGGLLDEVSPSAWLEQQRIRQQSAVRLSPPRSIVAESADEAIELLFPLMVERESTRRQPSLTRSEMRRQIVDTLVNEANYEPRVTLFERPKVHVGEQSGHFDVARWLHGQGVLTTTWTFNLQNLDQTEAALRSSHWLTHCVRDGGAIVRLSQKESRSIDSDSIFEAVYDPPRSGRGDKARMSVFATARDGWERNGVVALELEEFLERASVTA